MTKIILTDFIKNSLTAPKIAGKRFFLYKGKYRVRKYSFDGIYRYSAAFSALLKNAGIRYGDRVILKGQNSPEWVIAFFGIIFTGAVAVPLDASSAPQFDSAVLKKTGAKAVVCDRGNICANFGNAGIKTIFFDDIIEELEREELRNNPVTEGFKPERLIQIVFTSGTTQSPKGVKISAENIEANLESITAVMNKYANFFGFMVNPKILSVVPLSHLYGQLVGIFTPLMLKSSVMFTPTISPQHIFKIIKGEKIWMLATLPKLLELLKDYIIEKFGLNTEKFWNLYEKTKTKKWQLRLAAFIKLHLKIGIRLVAFMVGGAVLEPSVDEFFRSIAYSIFQGYGLTETAPLITLSDPIGGAAGSVGKVLGGQEFKIVDGEIYVRGNNVSSGYYKDRAKTQGAFKDGWFKTGDMAEADSSGNIYFRGRKDDLIVRYDGINVYPDDIEAVVKSFEDVKDCAVVGLKEGGRDYIHAFIILNEPSSKSAGEIIKLANIKLDARRRINRYYLWKQGDFPRTTTLKVKKRILVEMLKAKTGKEEHGLKLSSDKGTKNLYGIIKSIGSFSGRKIKPTDKLEDDAGLDSIGIIELASAIEERYGVALDDSLISRSTTVADLEQLINRPPVQEKSPLPYFGFMNCSIVKITRAAFQFFLYPFISLLYILKVKGKENLKNIKEPAVFAANHTSNLDTFVILYSLPLRIRFRISALMSIEHHFRHYFYRSGTKLRRIIEAIGFYLLVNLAVSALALSRLKGFKQVLENAGRTLDSGHHILIFPEGGVTPDGSIKKFESGVGIIAKDMNAQVVPVKIEGLYNILRNGILPWGHLPKLPRVTVTFGKPVTFKNKSYAEIANELEEIIKNRL